MGAPAYIRVGGGGGGSMEAPAYIRVGGGAVFATALCTTACAPDPIRYSLCLRPCPLQPVPQTLSATACAPDPVRYSPSMAYLPPPLQAYEGLRTADNLREQYVFLPAKVKEVYLVHLLARLEEFKVLAGQ